MLQIFLDALARKFFQVVYPPHRDHQCHALPLFARIKFARAFCEEIREKTFKTYAVKSIREISNKLAKRAPYIGRATVDQQSDSPPTLWIHFLHRGSTQPEYDFDRAMTL